jgi:hypothetical protein
MGAGTVENAQEFFRKLDDVGQFVATSEHEFRQVLDRITDELRCKLPGKQWGAARKFLNIFLRDALYNRFLCEYYKLALIEPFLEVPLDGLVGRWLYKRHRKKGGSDLRPWDAIIRLKPGVSDKYQEFARQVAEEEGCYRVDLDLLGYGRVDEPEDQTRFGRAACLNLPSP